MYIIYFCSNIKNHAQNTENPVKNTGVSLYNKRVKKRFRAHLERITGYLEQITGFETWKPRNPILNRPISYLNRSISVFGPFLKVRDHVENQKNPEYGVFRTI